MQPVLMEQFVCKGLPLLTRGQWRFVSMATGAVSVHLDGVILILVLSALFWDSIPANVSEKIPNFQLCNSL